MIWMALLALNLSSGFANAETTAWRSFECTAGTDGNPGDEDRYYSWGFGYDYAIAKCSYRPNPKAPGNAGLFRETFYLKLEGFGPVLHLVTSKMFFRCNFENLDDLTSKPFTGVKMVAAVGAGPVVGIFARSDFKWCAMAGFMGPFGFGRSEVSLQFTKTDLRPVKE
jgi:hypothetical protein